MAGRIMELALEIKGKIDRAIPESLRNAASSVADLDRRLAQLRGSSASIDAFARQAATVRRLSNEFRQAQAAVRAAAQAMRQQGGATRESQAAYTAAQNRVRALSQALTEERARLQQTSAALRAAGVDTTHLASEQRRLQAELTRTQAARGNRQNAAAARGRRDDASAKLAAATINFQGGMDIMKSITSPLVEAAKSAIKFESAMADVRKVVDFDSPQQFKEMGNDILAMSQRLPMAANDIAKIVAAGGQAGIAKEGLLEFAESAIKMGIAFDLTAEQAGDMMAKWRTAFHMNQDEVVSLADKINYLGNTTSASAPKISDVVTRIGPLGEIGGVASGEIAALGAAMVSTGVESDVAATGIKNLILGMTAGASATKTQQEAFQKLGFSATDMAKRMQTDAKGAILDLMKAIKKLPAEEQAATLNDLFGKESIGAIAPLLSNLDTLAEDLHKVGDASLYAGSMNQEAATRMETTEAKLQQFKSSTEAVGITVGQVLSPYIAQIAVALTPVVQGFAQWAQQNPGLVATLAAIAAAIAVIVTTLLAISIAVAGFSFISAQMAVFAAAVSRLSVVFTVLRTGLTLAAIGFRILTAAMMANPIGFVVGLIAILVSVLIYLWNTNEGFRAVVLAAWEMIQSKIGAVLGVMFGVVGLLIYLWNTNEGFRASVQAAWAAIQTAVATAVAAISAGWDFCMAALSAAWDSAVQAVHSALSSIEARVSSAVATIRSWWDSLTAALSRPINAVVNIFKSGGGDTEHLASGGIFNRGAFLTTFAEDSPEAAIPLDGSARALSLWQQAGQMLGVMPQGGASESISAGVSSKALGIMPRGNGNTIPTEPRKISVAPSNRGGSFTMEFSPTITISGGADANTANMIRQALEEQAQKFKQELPRMLRSVQANERRLSYE